MSEHISSETTTVRHELESGQPNGVASPHVPTFAPARGPLDGIRVLDTTNMLSGPYCTRLMADCGAEVIKVEPAQSDHNRGRHPVRDGTAAFSAI